MNGWQLPLLCVCVLIQIAHVPYACSAGVHLESVCNCYVCVQAKDCGSVGRALGSVSGCEDNQLCLWWPSDSTVWVCERSSSAAARDWWCVLGSWSHSHGWETPHSAESSTITLRSLSYICSSSTFSFWLMILFKRTTIIFPRSHITPLFILVLHCCVFSP